MHTIFILIGIIGFIIEAIRSANKKQKSNAANQIKPPSSSTAPPTQTNIPTYVPTASVSVEPSQRQQVTYVTSPAIQQPKSLARPQPKAEQFPYNSKNQFATKTAQAQQVRGNQRPASKADPSTELARLRAESDKAYEGARLRTQQENDIEDIKNFVITSRGLAADQGNQLYSETSQTGSDGLNSKLLGGNRAFINAVILSEALSPCISIKRSRKMQTENRIIRA